MVGFAIRSEINEKYQFFIVIVVKSFFVDQIWLKMIKRDQMSKEEEFLEGGGRIKSPSPCYLRHC